MYLFIPDNTTEAKGLTYHWLREGDLKKKTEPGLQKLVFKDTKNSENSSTELKDTTNQKDTVWLQE